MLTDDPGTPGPGKWEINVGWTTERTPGLTQMALPELDLNYGIGDRVELTYFVDYENLQGAGQGSRWGFSDSELAVKWRFFDDEAGGNQLSVYPQVGFLTPGTHSNRRGLADGGTTYQLPMEFEHDFRQLSVNLELGRAFAQGSGKGGWFGGVCLGHAINKGWDIDCEVHVDADARASRGEAVADVATRFNLSEHTTLMLLVGRDISNSAGPPVSLMSYVGLQFRL